MRIHPLLATLSAVAVAAVSLTAQSSDGFRFRSGVELVNVTATVTDDTGRFVSGLRKEDFTVYDDGARQDVTYFSSDRVPVSLGILLDTQRQHDQRQDRERRRPRSTGSSMTSWEGDDCSSWVCQPPTPRAAVTA